MDIWRANLYQELRNIQGADLTFGGNTDHEARNFMPDIVLETIRANAQIEVIYRAAMENSRLGSVLRADFVTGSVGFGCGSIENNSDIDAILILSRLDRDQIANFEGYLHDHSIPTDIHYYHSKTISIAPRTDRLRCLDAMLLGRSIVRSDDHFRSSFMRTVVESEAETVKAFLDARMPLAKEKVEFYFNRAQGYTIQ